MKTNKLLYLPGIFAALFLLLGGALYAQEDIRNHGSCSYCGMNRGQFSHSRILITYDEDSEAGLCSIHCAAVELAVRLDKTPKMIQVGDYNTKKLIDAEKAVWVIGGTKPGVMSKNGKWAFENKDDADAFVKSNGGVIASFDQSIKAAYEDMYADTQMIRERRKMKKIQMQHMHMEHK